MLEATIASSVLVVIVMFLRRLLKGKIILRLQYALWLPVAIRLLMPFPLFDSPVSIFSAVQVGNTRNYAVIPGRQVLGDVPDGLASSGQSLSDPGADVGPGDNATAGNPVTGDTGTHGDVVIRASRSVWLLGLGTVASWFVAQNLWFYMRLRKTRQKACISGYRLPVYLSSQVKSPCLFGLCPAVYIPHGCKADNEILNYVLAHEEAHYKHGDHLWAYVRCLCLAFHWFNPLAWLAAVVSRRDCEMACDESVLNGIADERRKAYGNTLIGMVEPQARPSDLLSGATTMTGGKSAIRERIEMIVQRPRVRLSATLLVILLMVLAVGCTFTGPGGTSADPDAALRVLQPNPDPAFPPIEYPFGEDMVFPGTEEFAVEGDYLTLAEAVYSINYSRSYLPEYEKGHGILARIDAFTEASAVNTTVFGDGEPSQEWVNDRSLYPFASGERRPAWDIVAVDTGSEANIPQHLLVDAMTGDLFIDSNCGGYFPSPYLERSKFGRIASTPLSAGTLTEAEATALLLALNFDLWNSQYTMRSLDLPAYVADNPGNRFVLDWGNTRMERSRLDPALRLVSEPLVQKISITSMEATGDGATQIKYQSYVEFQLQDSPVVGIGSDQTVRFEMIAESWVIADIGRFPWELDDYYQWYDNPGNLFDARKVSIGDSVAGLTISDMWDVEERKGSGYYTAKVRFSGEVTLTGRYYCATVEDLAKAGIGSDKPRPMFFADDESSKKLPRIGGDMRTAHFILTNVDEAIELLGPPGSETQATIVIDQYLIVRHDSSEGINQARLMRIVGGGPGPHT